MLTELTDQTFRREVLEADKPVLVEFWAQWCGPCHMLAPVLAEVATERAGQLAVYKINADENSRYARDYQVMALPTMLVFRDGQPVHALVGARPKARLLAELDAALAG